MIISVVAAKYRISKMCGFYWTTLYFSTPSLALRVTEYHGRVSTADATVNNNTDCILMNLYKNYSSYDSWLTSHCCATFAL